MPVATAKSNHHGAGRRLRLRFVGGYTPRLDAIGFQWSTTVKGSPWTRVPDKTSEKSPSLDAKLPKALADFFVAFAAWGAGDRQTAFSYSDQMNAKTIRNARDSDTQHVHKVFVRDDMQSCYKSILAGEGLARPKKNRAKHGRAAKPEKPITLWVSQDVLPADCVEIFWDHCGTDALTDVAHLNELLSALKDKPISGTTPSNLPRRQPFFGREKELVTIREALAPESEKWGILIAGPGGMGKTSLAIQAAADCPPGQFDSRPIFLSVKGRELDENGEHDLGPLLLPGRIQILNELASKLGQSHIANAHENERVKLLLDALRNERVLLILDNLESLPKPDRDELFKFVKNLPQGCKAILTSRATRNRICPIADTLNLEKLDQVAALETLADLARRNPLLDTTSRTERLALYTETGGNPLLLRWTAGQLGRGSCRTFADALHFLRSCEKGNDLLEFVFGDLAFEPEEENVLVALTYFASQANVGHIAALANLPASQTKTALDALANRLLIVPNPEETHYTLVPMLADFLRKHRRKVVAEVGRRLKKRAYELILENGKEERHLFHVLDAAWPIVAPALPLFITGPNQQLQEVCGAIDLFLDFTGRWDELISLHKQAEVKADAEDDFLAAGWRAYQIGWIEQLRENSKEAHACADRAAAYWKKVPTKAGALHRGRVTRLHGLAHQRAKNYDAAIACCREALKIWEPVVDKEPDIIARGLNTLADNERLSGDLVGAERDYSEALRIARAILPRPYAQGIRTYTGGLADLELDRWNWLEAKKLAHEALELCEKVPHEDMIAQNCHRIAKALLGQGKGAEGLSYCCKAENIYTKLRSPRLEAVRETRRKCEGRYTLYFTYGSNMNEQQFKERCPSSFFLCRAKLPDYRFVITSSGYASVLKEIGSTVHGVLCAVTEADEKELDRKEEVNEKIYRRERLLAVTEFGYALPSLVYVDTMEDKGVPHAGYLDKILAGARRHGLPMGAIAEIETWAKKK